MISIIIPTFNDREHLHRLLKCIENQTYENYETVVSDGGSTDGTVALAEKLADKVVRSGDDTVAEGRNQGVEVSEGELLV
ncbi:MAG: glycosyltransferase family 2 protein, partial [Candidatus Aenigmatarchaeota archaeon]